MDVIIRKAERIDLDKIVEIHISAFPDFFLAKMGRLFLRQYYRAYLLKGETLLVAVNNNNEIIGFVAGLLDSKSFYGYLKRVWYRFFTPVILAMLNYKLIITCLHRIKTILKSNKVNTNIYIPVGFHELTSIAVSPNIRNIGVGRLLMESYISSVKSMAGVSGIFLTTDFEGNENIHRFYKSLGFQVNGDFTQNKSRKMNAYILNFT